MVSAETFVMYPRHCSCDIFRKNVAEAKMCSVLVALQRGISKEPSIDCHVV